MCSLIRGEDVAGRCVSPAASRPHSEARKSLMSSSMLLDPAPRPGYSPKPMLEVEKSGSDSNPMDVLVIVSVSAVGEVFSSPVNTIVSPHLYLHVCCACMCAVHACVLCMHVCCACMCAVHACVLCMPVTGDILLCLASNIYAAHIVNRNSMVLPECFLF